MLITHALYPGDARPPANWEAINTQLGANHPGDPINEYAKSQSIQQQIRNTAARVIIFPESLIANWTDATDLFWQETITSLRHSGKTVLIGATVPFTQSDKPPLTHRQPFDLSAELAALHDLLSTTDRVGSQEKSPAAESSSYRNAVIIRGAASAMFEQRIPVPVGMWKPFSGSGVPLNLWGRGTTQIAGRRVTILICYEQLLAWPILTALIDRPSLIVAISNVHGVQGTPIPACQIAVVRAWSRLFRLPALFAVNV